MNYIDNKSIYDLEKKIMEKENVGPYNSRNSKAKPWKVIIADKDKDTHLLTNMMFLKHFSLEGRGIEFVNAFSLEETKKCIMENPGVSVILLDVSIDNNEDGFDIVRFIREELDNNIIRIILHAGILKHYGERDMIIRYDIDDYKENRMSISEIFISITNSLNAYRDKLIKQVLIKEVHHRVKNNLQIISSMLRLQTRYMKDKSTEEILMESQNRIDAMALIHENLYIYENLAAINIVNYIKSLVIKLFSTYGTVRNRIRLHTNIDDILLDIDFAIPCGLIINETVTNTLKHAFPDNYSEGDLWVNLKKISDNILRIEIKDNGIGLPKDFSFDSCDTLGLTLVEALTQQIRGEIFVNKDHGTYINIEFDMRSK